MHEIVSRQIDKTTWDAQRANAFLLAWMILLTIASAALLVGG